MSSVQHKPGKFALVFIALTTSGLSWAQAYPTRSVRLVLQTAAASTPDVLVRPIAKRLSESVGQQMIVDNRPGAAGIVAAQIVMNATADGYTVLLASSGAMSIAPFVAKKQPYDPFQDFSPVTLIAVAPLILTSHPSLPVKSAKELIELAKSKPKEILYASPGAATVQHLTIEMLSRAAGISMAHVPYKSGAPAVIDTVSGQVQLVITAVPAVLQQIKASRLRALGVTSIKRTAAVPEVPTIAESGVKGFESMTWYGIYAPKNTPAEIVQKLYGELRKATDDPGVKSTAIREGVDLEVHGPRPLGDFHRVDAARWQKVIRDLRNSNVSLE
jgi:tripartite-type tricarboxylate transporter receptor subunit TctC